MQTNLRVPHRSISTNFTIKDATIMNPAQITMPVAVETRVERPNIHVQIMEFSDRLKAVLLLWLIITVIVSFQLILTFVHCLEWPRGQLQG